MFDPEFYPTPISVLDIMGIDTYDKVVLEPSSGKGDIIDYLTEHGASQILCCEKNKDLAYISSRKANLISDDFFKVTSEQVSHVNLIVMNPPFSNADKHILHAYQISPEGCEIIALCNYETVNNDRGYGRSELKSLITNYGTADNLGDVFSSDAERTTDVNIGLVRLFKPVTSSNFDWDGFFYEKDDDRDGNGIMRYDEIRAIVNTYVAAVSCFDEVKAIGDRLNSLVGTQAITINIGNDKNEIRTKQDFARQFQIKQWKKVFDKLNIEKYVTKGVMEKINKFTNSRLNYPFTMKNIYRMLEVIVGTREQTMNDSIVEAVDSFTRHTKENRYGVEGWVTNSGYMLNKKFIIDYMCEANWKGTHLRIKETGYRFDYLMDLNKALCYITGTDHNKIGRLSQSSIEKDENGEFIKVYKYLNDDGTPKEHMKSYFEYKNNDMFDSNTWYQWGFFTFKLYKKSTMHIKFNDLKVWEQLNRQYAKIKGNVLPDKL